MASLCDVLELVAADVRWPERLYMVCPCECRKLRCLLGYYECRVPVVCKLLSSDVFRLLHGGSQVHEHDHIAITEVCISSSVLAGITGAA